MGINLLFSTLISLFVVVDPAGTSAVFATLTDGMPKAEQKKIAFTAVITAVILLVLFGLVGRAVLHYMRVSLPAFRVAGGLLLFVTAFRMIMGFHDPDQLTSEKSAYKDRSNIAIFPIAIPLLAGPGVITATLMFTTSAEGILDHAIVLFSVVAVQLFALGCLLSAARLSRIFGPTGKGIIARVMGILLAAMAVQFVADGARALMGQIR